MARLADYSLWLRRQGPEALDAEHARLETLPESADRNLQLALLLGQRGTAFHDPERTARLIMEVIAQAPANSTYAQVAQILFTAQPHPEACADSERLNTLSTQLASQLEDTVRQRALKSLEEQIKDRDEANSQ
jgi:hypothetical protein